MGRSLARTAFLRAAYGRRAAILGSLCALVFFLSSCTMAPPDHSLQTAAPGSTEQPWNEGQAVEEGVPQEDVFTEYVETVTTWESYFPAGSVDRRAQKLDKVVVCYDATYSMMGFVDIHGTNEYKSALSIVDSSASACFSGVPKEYYRLNQESGGERLESNAELSAVLNPSFYLNEDMLRQPERVMLQNAAAVQMGLRMNEPIQGFYHAVGLPVPSQSREGPFPASQATSYAQPNGFVVLITDLEELQTNLAFVKDLENRVYARDMIVSLTAVRSTFSGFVPLWSKGMATWFEWGAMPTGSCEYMFDYDDYRIGLTLDPGKRKAQERPFYILCMGPSDAVNEYGLSLGSQLTASGIPYSMSLFDSSIQPMQYALSDSIDKSKVTVSELGMNQLPPLSADAVAHVQLEGLRAQQQGDDKRWVEVPFSYMPRLSDPRIGSFTVEDFSCAIYLQRMDADGVYGQRTEVGDEIVALATVENWTSGVTALQVRNSFPQGRLAKGQYKVVMELWLNPPKQYASPPWVSGFDLTLDNDTILGLTNGRLPFDGSRTIGVNSLVGAIMDYRQKSASALAIGEYAYELNVAAP